ncbi:MAG: MFS transporter, partial [Clostridiales bacterium]|nr:MFS transporter [Clostridiales bacterium]
MGIGETLKSIVGSEGNTKEYLKPMIGYTSANIMLGGAGYPLNLYQAQFLTFVEGLGTKAAGTISLISGLTDAVTDPIMGVITDRTHSKYGKHRRYLLWAVLPFAVSYIMRWYSFGISSSGNLSSVFVYYLLASILYSTAFTMANIPHTAMLPSVAPQYFVRTQFKMVEYIMNSVGQITSFIFTALALGGFSLKKAFMKLPDPTPADRGKYLMIGLILTVWFSWPLIYSFFHTGEPSSIGEKFEPVHTRNVFRDYMSIFKNRSFRQYFVISLFYSMTRGFYNTSDQNFIVSVSDKY